MEGRKGVRRSDDGGDDVGDQDPKVKCSAWDYEGKK
jgi:hypothetical protein